MTVTGSDDRGLPADGGSGRRRWRRVLAVAVEESDDGGACSFVRAPIAMQLSPTASSRQEEYDGDIVCTKFLTVRKLWMIY